MLLDTLKELFSTSDEVFPAPEGGMMSINEMNDQSDDLANLSATLQYNKAAVEAAHSSGHPSLASFLETLSYFHENRFTKVVDPSDLKEAVHRMKTAIDATPAEDTELPLRYSGLARYLARLFRELDDLASLELAFKYQHLSVAGTPEGDPALLERMTDLSVSYSDRSERLGDRNDLEESLKCDIAVVAAVASDDPELPR
ncbi:hypothetical protein FPV67DRAFT_111355 [Lyophyllum atratum]|nr:hypothetical protein FPV67DRAFT_111355 [Lyophyllum atratum]